MKEFIQESVSKRFMQLPNDVQDVILSDTLATTFLESMQKANLSLAKTKECNEQATLVLVGLSTTKEFKTYVTEELGLEILPAQALFETISSQVFIPVRDCLLKAFDTIKKDGDTAQTTANDTHSDPYREQMV